MSYIRLFASTLAIATFPLVTVTAAQPAKKVTPAQPAKKATPAQPAKKVTPSDQTGSRYDPNCKLEYIKRNNLTIPTNIDVYVVRVHQSKVTVIDTYDHHYIEYLAKSFADKANPITIFAQQYSAGKPVTTCNYNEISYNYDLCKNNYTGNRFNPKQGMGYVVDRNGHVTQKACDFCFEDKSGNKFLIKDIPEFQFNRKSGWETNFYKQYWRNIVDTNGRWTGAIETYRFTFWRKVQENLDFISARTVAYGFYCSFSPAPSFKF